MRDTKSLSRLSAALRFLTAVLIITSHASATEKKLHNFGNGSDGVGPQAGLISDAAGNLYGTTTYGGDIYKGTVFEFSPDGSGGWTESRLHDFGHGKDGVYPYADLIFDAAGNLYGTTYAGGDQNGGTVFELSPNGSGGWTEKKLHNFYANAADGYSPEGALLFDAAGNLYGTTASGGDYGAGTVFELSPNGAGDWTEKKLYNFGHSARDGATPQGSLIFDGGGHLYGTTVNGGSYSCTGLGCGTVFELSPNGLGGWTLRKLHNFGNGTDGAYPGGSLLFDAAAHLYGTTQQGGSYNKGTVFELTSNGHGGWTEKKLHNFGNGTDGAVPVGLTFDIAGNLYGATQSGGASSCSDGCGTVFQMKPSPDGTWTETKLHNFNYNYPSHTDGAYPYAGVLIDGAGNLYGTTYGGGGSPGDGILWEVENPLPQ